MIRKMHSKTVVAAGVMALVMAMSAGLSAQAVVRRGKVAPGGPGGFPIGFPGLAMLDLSDQQREQVRDVMQRHRDEMRQVGDRHRQAFEAQRAAIETYPLNEELVRSTTQALSAVQLDMALLQARVHSGIWSLLTPEQQEQSKTMSKKLTEARKGRVKVVAPRQKPKPQF
jgi:Spy/CpxP family protein refolding chaperone